MEDPADLLPQVHDRASFLAFVRALVADRADEVAKERVQPSSPYGPGANGWQNDSIEAYLEAALAWAEDTRLGETQGLGWALPGSSSQPFLYCGKVHE